MKLSLVVLLLQCAFMTSMSLPAACAQDDSARLKDLARSVADVHKNLKTWQGVASIKQSHRVADPVVNKPVATNSKSGATAEESKSQTNQPGRSDESGSKRENDKGLPDDQSGSGRIPNRVQTRLRKKSVQLKDERDQEARGANQQESTSVLKGDFIQSFEATVDFQVDWSLESSWCHWQSGSKANLRSLENGNARQTARAARDIVSIVTPTDYYSYNLSSDVIALDDPTGTGKILATRPSSIHRKFAVKRPAEDAEKLMDRAHVFIPIRLFGYSGMLPEVHVLQQAELVDKREGDRTSIRKDPDDSFVTICTVAYRSGRADRPGLVIDARYREIEKSAAVIESIQARSESDKSRLNFSITWKWEKQDDVYLPVNVRNEHFDQNDGKLQYSREVTILTSKVNQPVDPATFTEQGLNLAVGDFLQTLPSKEVQVQTQAGLRPVTVLLQADP